MNHAHTAISISRVTEARLRAFSKKNSRTPQKQIEHWLNQNEEVDLATLEKILEKDI
jgi:predicted DNA-binding protein